MVGLEVGVGRGVVPGWMEKKPDFEGRDLVACKTEKKLL